MSVHNCGCFNFQELELQSLKDNNTNTLQDGAGSFNSQEKLTSHPSPLEGDKVLNGLFCNLKVFMHLPFFFKLHIVLNAKQRILQVFK